MSYYLELRILAAKTSALLLLLLISIYEVQDVLKSFSFFIFLLSLQNTQANTFTSCFYPVCGVYLQVHHIIARDTR
jgi:hypothetical protein